MDLWHPIDRTDKVVFLVKIYLDLIFQLCFKNRFFLQISNEVCNIVLLYWSLFLLNSFLSFKWPFYQSFCVLFVFFSFKILFIKYQSQKPKRNNNDNNRNSQNPSQHKSLHKAVNSFPKKNYPEAMQFWGSEFKELLDLGSVLSPPSMLELINGIRKLWEIIFVQFI